MGDVDDIAALGKALRNVRRGFAVIFNDEQLHAATLTRGHSPAKAAADFWRNCKAQARIASGERCDESDEPTDHEQCGSLTVQRTGHISSPHVLRPISIKRTKREQENFGAYFVAVGQQPETVRESAG
jgi:hypothetical protein